MTIHTDWIKVNMLNAKQESYERRLTEAELKVQRSLQKLSIPDWYLNKRSTPPRILKNLTPIEFRPSSWKLDAFRKKYTVNTSSSDQPKPYKENHPPSTMTEVNENTIDDQAQSRRSLSFPKISPCRKIDNINIVLPLQEPIPCVHSKTKMYSHEEASKNNTQLFNDTNDSGTAIKSSYTRSTISPTPSFWSTTLKNDSRSSDKELPCRKKNVSAWFYRNAKNLPEISDPVSRTRNINTSSSSAGTCDEKNPIPPTVPNVAKTTEKPQQGHVREKVRSLLSRCQKNDTVSARPYKESMSARNIVKKLINAWENGPIKMMQSKSWKPDPLPRTKWFIKEKLNNANNNAGQICNSDSQYVRFNEDIDELATKQIEITKAKSEPAVRWITVPECETRLIKTNSLGSERSNSSSGFVSSSNEDIDGKNQSSWFCSTIKKDQVIWNNCKTGPKEPAQLDRISDISTIEDAESNDNGTPYAQLVFIQGTYV